MELPLRLLTRKLPASVGLGAEVAVPAPAVATVPLVPAVYIAVGPVAGPQWQEGVTPEGLSTAVLVPVAARHAETVVQPALGRMAIRRVPDGPHEALHEVRPVLSPAAVRPRPVASAAVSPANGPVRPYPNVDTAAMTPVHEVAIKGRPAARIGPEQHRPIRPASTGLQARPVVIDSVLATAPNGRALASRSADPALGALSGR